MEMNILVSGRRLFNSCWRWDISNLDEKRNFLSRTIMNRVSRTLYLLATDNINRDTKKSWNSKL